MTLDFVFRTMTGHDTAYWSERCELDWFDKYANPRDDSGKGVLTANWNHFPRALACESHRTDEGKAAQEFNWGTKGRRFQAILEEMGYHLEWSDQASRCSHCYGCITEGPDYYGDTAHMAILGDCDTVCEDCIRKDFAEEYLETLEASRGNGAVHISGIDPAKYGYDLVQDGYENGFHPGQNDNPRAIFKELDARGLQGIIFKIDSSGQFDIGFSVWHKPVETETDAFVRRTPAG